MAHPAKGPNSVPGWLSKSNNRRRGEWDDGSGHTVCPDFVHRRRTKVKTISKPRGCSCLGNRYNYNERLARRNDRSEHSAASLPASPCCGPNVEGDLAIGWTPTWPLPLFRCTEPAGRAPLIGVCTAPFALNNRRNQANPLRRKWTIGQGGRKQYRVGIGRCEGCMPGDV